MDFAGLLQWIADDCYASAEQIVVVCDNRNPHTPAALYEAFAPAEARRLAERFRRRIPDLASLCPEVQAWEEARNAAMVKVDWHFTTADARSRRAGSLTTA